MKTAFLFLFTWTLFLIVIAIPLSIVVGGVWISYHYGGWIFAIVGFVVSYVIAIFSVKLLRTLYHLFMAFTMVKLTEDDIKDLNKR